VQLVADPVSVSGECSVWLVDRGSPSGAITRGAFRFQRAGEGRRPCEPETQKNGCPAKLLIRRGVGRAAPAGLANDAARR
jgi:hypothetical protein